MPSITVTHIHSTHILLTIYSNRQLSWFIDFSVATKTPGCNTKPISWPPTPLTVTGAHNVTRSLPRANEHNPATIGLGLYRTSNEPFTMSAQKVVMVTGGTGLVGSAIKEVIDAEGNSEEKWVYLSSKVSQTRITRRRRNLHHVHTLEDASLSPRG